MAATVSQLLGVSGPGTSVTIDGKTWTLTRSTKRIQAEWSKWLTDRAEERAFLTAERYREKAAEFFAEADAITRKYRDVDPSSITQEENLAATAKRDLFARKGRVMETEARAIVERLNDRIAAGEFEYFGNVAIDLAQQNLPGQIMLIYLCLKPKHPDVTVEEVERAHLVDSKGENHIQEWRKALLRSEGCIIAEGEPSPSEVSTKKNQNTTTGGQELQ